MQAAVCAYVCISLDPQVDRSDEYITNYAQNPPYQLTSSMCLCGKTSLARENIVSMLERTIWRTW